MKRVISLALVALAAAAVFGRATCRRAPAGIVVTEAMAIRDHVYYHNVGIAFGDGKYYTINGGNAEWGQVNCYDAKGRLLDTWMVELDGRGIYWHPDDELLYIKNYGGDLHSLDPDDGEPDLDLEDVFEDENSSPAASADGEYYFELADGRVRVLESLLGEEERSFELTGVSDENGYRSALAASAEHLFTWDEDGTVRVHDLDGNYVDRFRLPRNGFGFSLTWTNGMLWIAEDADGSDEGADGYWYGYRITGLK